MMSKLTTVLRVFVEGCRRLLSVWLLVLALIAVCLATTTPAIDDFNTLLSRNFVRQDFIPSFEAAPLSVSRIAPYFSTWPFYVAGWMFLLGGCLEVLVHRNISTIGLFVRSCRRYFLRLVRLVLLELCLKALVLLVVLEIVNADPGGWMFATRPFSLWLSVLLLAITTVVFTYAAIRTIAEDRLSMVGSVVAAARFVKRRFGSVVMLSLLNMGVFALGAIGAMVIVQPETISDVPVFLSFLCLVQLLTVLTTYASGLSYLESQLGHSTRRIVMA